MAEVVGGVASSAARFSQIVGDRRLLHRAVAAHHVGQRGESRSPAPDCRRRACRTAPRSWRDSRRPARARPCARRCSRTDRPSCRAGASPWPAARKAVNTHGPNLRLRRPAGARVDARQQRRREPDRDALGIRELRFAARRGRRDRHRAARPHIRPYRPSACRRWRATARRNASRRRAMRAPAACRTRASRRGDSGSA